MSEKRKDKKGRLLQTGESQRADGRYAYKYVDGSGSTKFIYSWKLVPTDSVPKGKPNDACLRDKIKKVRRDIEDGIDTSGQKMTVLQLYEKYTRGRGNVKTSTVKSRRTLMQRLENDRLGGMAIGDVKPSDAREWAVRMSAKYSYRVISNDRRSLSAAFHMAIQDDCIRKNPFDFQVSTVIEDDTESRKPLTPEQEKSLLEFMAGDKVYARYCDEFIILLGTGLRISELCGLTVDDVDMEGRRVIVSHQLLRHSGKGYCIEKPKTQSGMREIPMRQDVYEAFQRALECRRASGITVDGCSGFLFLSLSGRPKVADDYEKLFHRIAGKYKQHCDRPLPDVFTPHVLRHTFCTRMAHAGMNPKNLQYIMGHGSIVMTLDFYAHATYASAKEEMERISA